MHYLPLMLSLVMVVMIVFWKIMIVVIVVMIADLVVIHQVTVIRCVLGVVAYHPN